MIRSHTLKRPKGLTPCRTVVDVGAGIRPFRWYSPDEHICIEPYEPYADCLAENGYPVIRKTAIEALPSIRAEGVYLLDVIEHMDRQTGRMVIELAQEAATVQVVIYTPYGFSPQEGDAWDMGGEEWQLHRSGWLPEDFPGWNIQINGKGFFAIWDV